MSNKNPNKIKAPKADVVYYTITYFIMAILMVIIVYPLYFIVVASFTDPVYVNSGDILLYPKGFTTIGYQRILEEARLWSGYMNTIIYAFCGTIFGLVLVLPAGYAISRKDLPYRNVFMAAFVFTMYFGGGLIPTYMIIQGLGLHDTRFLMIILGSASVYNMILVRSFFANTIPLELQESAVIDGCGNGRLFFSIVLPLSKPIIAVISLYIAVAHWNSYFNPMIYIVSRDKQPLQIVLRDLLNSVNAFTTDSGITDPQALEQLAVMSEVIKYGVIIVATLPILCFYPFIQRYFVKGVMIGALKG